MVRRGAMRPIVTSSCRHGVGGPWTHDTRIRRSRTRPRGASQATRTPPSTRTSQQRPGSYAATRREARASGLLDSFRGRSAVSSDSRSGSPPQSRRARLPPHQPAHRLLSATTRYACRARASAASAGTPSVERHQAAHESVAAVASTLSISGHACAVLSPTSPEPARSYA